MEKTPVSSGKKYFYEMNFIRAIACLCVVMVHITASHYTLNGSSFNWATLSLNQLARFGTPAFAILSGFLLYNQAINRGFTLKRFISSRFTKIVVPFIIWSFVYLFVRSYSFPWTENGVSTKDFLYSFLVGDSYYHLYFIIVVVQFYILFPILQLAKSKKSLITLTLIAFFLNYFFMEQPFEIGSGLINSFFKDRASIFYWLFYFVFGGLMVHFWSPLVLWIKKNATFSVMLGVIVTIFTIYEYSTFGFYSSTRITNMFNLPILFVSGTGLYFLMERWGKLRSYIVQLGNLSMGVYLVHPLIIYIIRDLAPVLLDRTRWIPLTFAITLVTSIIVVKIIHKLPFGQYIVTVAAAKKKPKAANKEEKVERSLTA
ncbi:acyltransferase [Sediminibacillus massiliensis]|uniref:acyltransferase n=1 Tax=Sediminibacillus massiliensis TaxID=1926277 RepID=UPI000988508C|nr:acyltransferase [Sediminibacillus massiliensis]